MVVDACLLQSFRASIGILLLERHICLTVVNRGESAQPLVYRAVFRPRRLELADKFFAPAKGVAFRIECVYAVMGLTDRHVESTYSPFRPQVLQVQSVDETHVFAIFYLSLQLPCFGLGSGADERALKFIGLVVLHWGDLARMVCLPISIARLLNFREVQSRKIDRRADLAASDHI